jgi:hypothetical protein
MAILTFNNFRGLNLAEDSWKQNFAKYVMGVDVIGVHDNTDTDVHAIPGVLQGLRVMTANTEAASTNDITDLCCRFSLNSDVSSNAWALGNGLRVYEYTSTTWTKRYAGAGVDFVAGRNTSDGGGLLSFQDSLWVATNGDVNRITAPTGGITAPYVDGNTVSANFASTATSSRPTLQFERQAYFGNNNFVSTLSEDATPIWTQKALTLDDEWTIESMAVYNGRIYISAQNDLYTRVFIWNGVPNSKVIDVFNVLGEPKGVSLIYFDGRLWAIGASSPGVFSNIYIFDGASFKKFLELPLGILQGRDTATIYNGNLVIASTHSSNITSYQDGTAGIWMIGKKGPGQPYEPVLAYNPSNGVLDSTMGGLFATGETRLMVGTHNNSGSDEYEIWSLLTSNQQTAGIWSSNPIDAGLPDKPKMWHGIQLNTELDQETYNSNRTITISYRVDQASDDALTGTPVFTTLTTVRGEDSGTYPDPNRYIPIGVTGRNIEIRLQFNTSGSVNTTLLRGFDLEYSEATR